MAQVKKRKIINYRQLKVAEVWERDPKQSQQDIIAVLLSEFDIKVSQPTVSRDIKILDQRNLDKSDAIIRAVKAQLTIEYEFIYSEAIAAWNGPDDSPALLGQAQNALKSIRELYGLDTSQKLDHSITVRLEKEMDDILEHLQTVLDADTYQKVIEALAND